MGSRSPAQKHQRRPREAQAPWGHSGTRLARSWAGGACVHHPPTSSKVASWAWVWDVFGVTGTGERNDLPGRSFSSQLCRLCRLPRRCWWPVRLGTRGGSECCHCPKKSHKIKPQVASPLVRGRELCGAQHCSQMLLIKCSFLRPGEKTSPNLKPFPIT